MYLIFLILYISSCFGWYLSLCRCDVWRLWYLLTLTSNLPGWTWSTSSAFLDSSPWLDSNPVVSWALLFCFMRITQKSVWEANGHDLEICSVFSFVLQDCSPALVATSQIHFSDFASRKSLWIFPLVPYSWIANAKWNCVAEMGTLHYSAALGQVFSLHAPGTSGRGFCLYLLSSGLGGGGDKRCSLSGIYSITRRNWLLFSCSIVCN